MILTDRGVDENHVAIPSLLATATMQHHLVTTKKRTSVDMILETAEPREVHHFATLLGYGASAINPYLAHSTIKELIDNGMLDKDYYAAVDDYDAAVLHGIVKSTTCIAISYRSEKCNHCLNCIVLLFDYTQLQFKMISICFYKALFL